MDVSAVIETLKRTRDFVASLIGGNAPTVEGVVQFFKDVLALAEFGITVFGPGDMPAFAVTSAVPQARCNLESIKNDLDALIAKYEGQASRPGGVQAAGFDWGSLIGTALPSLLALIQQLIANRRRPQGG